MEIITLTSSFTCEEYVSNTCKRLPAEAWPGLMKGTFSPSQGLALQKNGPVSPLKKDSFKQVSFKIIDQHRMRKVTVVRDIGMCKSMEIRKDEGVLKHVEENCVVSGSGCLISLEAGSGVWIVPWRYL